MCAVKEPLEVENIISNYVVGNDQNIRGIFLWLRFTLHAKRVSKYASGFTGKTTKTPLQLNGVEKNVFATICETCMTEPGG